MKLPLSSVLLLLGSAVVFSPSPSAAVSNNVRLGNAADAVALEADEVAVAVAVAAENGNSATEVPPAKLEQLWGKWGQDCDFCPPLFDARSFVTTQLRCSWSLVISPGSKENPLQPRWEAQVTYYRDANCEGTKKRWLNLGETNHDLLSYYQEADLHIESYEELNRDPFFEAELSLRHLKLTPNHAEGVKYANRHCLCGRQDGFWMPRRTAAVDQCAENTCKMVNGKTGNTDGMCVKQEASNSVTSECVFKYGLLVQTTAKEKTLFIKKVVDGKVVKKEGDGEKVIKEKRVGESVGQLTWLEKSPFVPPTKDEPKAATPVAVVESGKEETPVAKKKAETEGKGTSAAVDPEDDEVVAAQSRASSAAAPGAKKQPTDGSIVVDRNVLMSGDAAGRGQCVWAAVLAGAVAAAAMGMA